MSMVKTPFIDAAIADNPKLQSRLENAKRLLETGIADQKIFNVDFNEAKEDLHIALEPAFRKVHEAILTAQHAGAFTYFAGAYNWMDYTMFWEPQSVVKMLRTLTKKFDGYKPGAKAADHQVGLNVIYRYMDVLSDSVKMVELLKQAKPFVVKGRKPAVQTDAQKAQAERDLQNTGICPVCQHRQKLTIGGTMVDHGYTLRWGSRNGRCFGVGHQAWELSSEGAVAYLEILKKAIVHAKEQLAELEANKAETVLGTKSEKIRFGYSREVPYTYKRGEEGFEEAVVRAKALLRRDIEGMTADVPEVENRIKSWTKQPLTYGGAETQERWKSRLLNKK